MFIKEKYRLDEEAENIITICERQDNEIENSILKFREDEEVSRMNMCYFIM